MTRPCRYGVRVHREPAGPSGHGHRLVARLISAGLIAAILGYAVLVVFLTRVSRVVDGALELFETVDDEDGT